MLRTLLLAALWVPLACGQIFPTVPEVVQVDALVTGAQGLPVADLTAADFEVWRNFEVGKQEPLQILSAAYVRNPRTVLLVVDDLGLSLDAINSVRAALGKFVDEQMRPGDRAAIVRTGVGSGAVQTFTGAKDLLHAAIDQVKCHPARIAGNVVAGSLIAFSAGSRAAIRFAVEGLRQLPGRKAVVVLSSNLAMFRNALESAARLVDSANQAAAVLYGLDPDIDPDTDTNAAARSMVAVSFAVLAEQTGGAVIAPDTGLTGALDRVLREQDGYYLIDYHPKASLTPLAGTITVRVKRQGLLVRSRTGRIVIPGNTSETIRMDTIQMAPRQQMLQAVADPFSSPGIRVRLTGIFVNSAEPGSPGAALSYQVAALSYIDARDLGFIHYLNGVHRYGLDVLILVCSEDGQIVQENSRGFSMDMSDGDYRRALTHGLVFALSVPLPLPGPFQIRAIVGDGITGKVGFASQFLEVPDADGKQFSLSSILLMGEKSTNPIARPPGIQLDVTNENPAIRIFKPGQSIVYRYAVLNALAGPDKKPALEAQTRLFRNGRAVFEAQPLLLAVPTGEDPKRLAVAGKITLSSSMEPGDYVLYVTVADKLAPDQPRRVAQAGDFRIEP
ncbi:MAG TPA: VWA domain-containing protein [Candidatus Acidoferrales bacterium]|jgi:VWFA-related protein|nr:VWA domain-containing protein [Candidatus Acidoferrales bacterium]